MLIKIAKNSGISANNRIIVAIDQFMATIKYLFIDFGIKDSQIN